MAVDNLPCELPRESSEHFSTVLRDMVPALGQADFSSDFEGLHLPPHLKKAVITHRGELTPELPLPAGFPGQGRRVGALAGRLGREQGAENPRVWERAWWPARWSGTCWTTATA